MGRLLSVPNQGPSGEGEDKNIEYVFKYRSPGGHSEHARPKTTISEQGNSSSTSTLSQKGAQLEHIEDWDRQSYQLFYSYHLRGFYAVTHIIYIRLVVRSHKPTWRAHPPSNLHQ